MNRGERQEFNNTKGRCFCLRESMCIKQDIKTGLLKVAKSIKTHKKYHHFKLVAKYVAQNQFELSDSYGQTLQVNVLLWPVSVWTIE